jgi:hypothetical protein
MNRVLVIFLFIVFCACGRKNVSDAGFGGSVIKIDLFSEPETILENLSEFASRVEYIQLQTLENSLIGDEIRKIIKQRERIYIQTEESILSFDMDGKFLCKIDEKGRGPEEYPNIEDFDVSSDNKSLMILSGLDHKLLLYDISQTGFTFKKILTLKDPSPYRIRLVPESQNAFLAIPPWSGNEQTLSLMINTAGDTIHYKPNCYKYKMVKKMNFRAANEMLVYNIANLACFKESFSDTVFCVKAKDNSFKPRLIFDSHGTLTTPQIRGGSELAGNRLTYIANIFETSRYVFYYYFSSGPTRNRILFDKKTSTAHKLNIESELVDDLSCGPDFNIEFLNNYCSDDKLFSFVDAITLKKYVGGADFKNAKVKNMKKKDEMKKLADSLKETDNPILIMVTPKE